MGIKVAVTGRIRSGKDTFAEVFINDGYKEFKFGTGIAEVIKKYFPEEWAKGKPRYLYQFIGQKFRELDPDVWVKYMLRDVDAYLKDNPYADIIVDDMRQTNEADKLRQAGFIIIKVVARKDVRIQRMKDLGDQFKEEDLNHETELQSDKVIADITIENNGSLKHLYNKAKDIKKEIERGA